jgi:hypothetical protein
MGTGTLVIEEPEISSESVALDSITPRTHPSRMRGKRSLLGLLFGLLVVAASAHADAIQKWQTPGGSLYFGNRPPLGSTLLETIPDRPPAARVAPTIVESDLARAAADGREIIRRRAADRAEERRLGAERAARLEVLEAADRRSELPPFIIIDSFPRCRAGESCFRRPHDHRRLARLDAPRHPHGRSRLPSFRMLAPPASWFAPSSGWLMPSGRPRGGSGS